MERQEHGFIYEDYCEQEHGVSRKAASYTSKWDATYNGKPCSIKTADYGAEICMADIFRQADIQEDFYMFVSFHNPLDKTEIWEEYLLYVNGKEYHTLFNEEIMNKYKTLIQTISNDRADDAVWKKSISEYRKEWSKKTDNIVRPRPKRDHKKQKRVQCAIGNKEFYQTFLPKYQVKEFIWDEKPNLMEEKMN